MDALYKKYNYPSAVRFYQILKENGITDQSHSQVKAFVDKQAISQVHKPVRQLRSKERAITASVVNETFQIDLLDYYKYSKKNNGFHFLLVAVDVFTRKAYIEPCKSKSPEDTVKAFKKIVNDSKPMGIYHDNGKEWLGAFKKFVDSEGIMSMSNQINDHNALGIVDRFSRTIKEMIERYMTANNTTSYVSQLPKMVKIYNETPQGGIANIPPANVEGNRENTLIISNLNKDKQIANKKVAKKVYTIKVNDKVRVMNEKTIFNKGYSITYSKDVFTVVSISGDRATLNNGKIYAMDKLLLVPEGSVNLKNDKKEKLEQTEKAKRKLRREGIDTTLKFQQKK